MSSLAHATPSASSSLRVRLLSPLARLPERGSKGAAGYDLFASVPVVLPVGGRARVATDIAVSIPDGTYGRVAPRSGLAVKHGIDVLAGVVDKDYRGGIDVVMINHGDKPFRIDIGDKIAQLVLEKIAVVSVVEVDSLEETERGAAGFGSTGV